MTTRVFDKRKNKCYFNKPNQNVRIIKNQSIKLYIQSVDDSYRGLIKSVS